MTPASVHSPLLHCPGASCQPARQHLPLEFYLIWGCVSKPLTSESLVARAHSDPLGDDVAKQWPGAGLPPGNVCAVVLLQSLLSDCGQVPACPRESSRDHEAAEVQSLWQNTTHSQGGFTASLFQYQQTWLFSGVCWDLCLWEALRPLPDAFLAGEPLLPCGPWTPQTSLPAPVGSPFPPELRQVSSCGVSDSVLPCL